MDGLLRTIQHLKKPSKKPDLYLTRSTLMETHGTTYTGKKHILESMEFELDHSLFRFHTEKEKLTNVHCVAQLGARVVWEQVVGPDTSEVRVLANPHKHWVFGA